MISDKLIRELNEHKMNIHQNKDFGFDLLEKEFIKCVSILTPQSYGNRIENRIKYDNDWGKVKASECLGDAKTQSKNYVEVKVSIITPINNSLNIVQIRLFHSIDYYLCVAYDLRDLNNYKKYSYLLTHNQMEKECVICASNAHGTKNTNIINNNVEKRLSFNINENDKTFLRWNKKYQINDERLRKL